MTCHVHNQDYEDVCYSELILYYRKRTQWNVSVLKLNRMKGSSVDRVLELQDEMCQKDD